MEHPAFADAGGKEGLEIWTIDNFEPVAVPDSSYGKFYNGDAYIVLKTTGDQVLSHDLHFWLGEESTQDKRGAAAILSVVLDDALGGRAVHSREVQHHESDEFLGYFKPAVRYLEGGLESGFNQVTTNAGAERRLLKLTGCDNLRISEVPADVSSLTRSHCFILEVEHDIFVLLSPEAKATQRRKIISIANSLRDQEHNGRATIEIIDEFSSDEDVQLFFDALGSGSLEELTDDSDEEQSYTREGSAVLLYRVAGSAEVLQLVALSKPYTQSQLSSDFIYILDTPASGVFLWIGSNVEDEVKKVYNAFAQSYLEEKAYPSWVHVSKVSEGAENCSFKQHFSTWNVAPAGTARLFLSAADEGYYSGDAEESLASARLIGKTGAARGFMPDDGSGSFVVYRVSGEEAVEVYTSESEWQVAAGVRVGAFYQDDVFLVKYQYAGSDGSDAYVLYCWIGSGADEEEKKSAATIAARMYEELDGEVIVVKVPQGKETNHFLKVFKGNVVVLLGGHSSEYKDSNLKGTFEDDGVRLFKVTGTQVGVDMRAQQVAERPASLADDAVFVLETRDVIYVWRGQESMEAEAEAAEEFVRRVSPDGREVAPVERGAEPAEFWDALGGSEDEATVAARSGWQSELNRRVNAQTQLWDVIVSLKGAVRFERVPQFSQEDLSPDGAYVLDTGDELYLWLGANVPERVNNARETIIEEYLRDDGLERGAAVVVTAWQGHEPALFRQLFPAWEPLYFDNLISYEDLKSETKAANSK